MFKSILILKKVKLIKYYQHNNKGDTSIYSASV